MKSRLFYKMSKKQTNTDKAPTNIERLNCLNGKDVIESKISDHHPIIHNGVLFWNIMMQGRIRNGQHGIGYNNGFGIIESESDYLLRLDKIAQVIAEMIEHYPKINVVGLCEGPIKPLHVQVLLKSLKKSHVMEKFFRSKDAEFYHPDMEGFQNWGLLMLANKNYQVDRMQNDMISHPMLFEKLANRFQLWRLSNKSETKYFALGHFPFGGDEDVTKKENLSLYGSMYCHFVKNILNQYENDDLILCADFNLNPYLISEWNERAADKIENNNSILLVNKGATGKCEVNTATVDGILLSNHEKQKYQFFRQVPGLFDHLKKESHAFISILLDNIVKNRHKDIMFQRVYDKQFGLTLKTNPLNLISHFRQPILPK